MDLTKLTPAPWSVYRFMQPAGSNDYTLLAPDGKTYCQSKTDMEFAVLARAAFDVMMRRGWYAYPDTIGKPLLWAVAGMPAWAEREFKKMGNYPDPFTALIEAEKWYKRNV